MSTPIDSLFSVEGVRGVALLDSSGACVAHKLPPPYEPSLMGMVVSMLETATEAFTSLAQPDPAMSLLARFEEGFVMLRHIGPLRLVALLAPQTNLAMFHVALNVVALHAGKDGPAIQGALPPPDSMSTHSMSTHATARLGESHHMGESQRLSSSGGSLDEVIPPDAIGRAIVYQLLSVCNNYIGPASKIVLKQHLTALGVSSRTLRKGQYGDLVAGLAQRIPTSTARTAFTKQAMSLAPSR